MIEQEIESKKILEVGCGIALASHVLKARGANITATDYHPEVQGFLDKNTELNQTEKIPFILEDWNSKTSAPEKFDLIVGSDLLYEEDHIELLSLFFEKQALKKCKIIIVDPKRGKVNKFTRAMEELGFYPTK